MMPCFLLADCPWYSTTRPPPPPPHPSRDSPNTHLTALRAWCTRCLPGWCKPDVLRPGIVGTRGSMVIRLRQCMKCVHPSPTPTLNTPPLTTKYFAAVTTLDIHDSTPPPPDVPRAAAASPPSPPRRLLRAEVAPGCLLVEGRGEPPEKKQARKRGKRQ